MRCQECKEVAYCGDHATSGAAAGPGGAGAGTVPGMWSAAQAKVAAEATVTGGALRCRGCSTVKHRRCCRATGNGGTAAPGTPEPARRGATAATMGLAGEESDDEGGGKEPAASAASWGVHNVERRAHHGQDGAGSGEGNSANSHDSYLCVECTHEGRISMECRYAECEEAVGEWMQECRLCGRAVCSQHNVGRDGEGEGCLECVAIIQARTADHTQAKVQGVVAMAGVRALIGTQLPASRMAKGAAGQQDRTAHAAACEVDAIRAGQCRLVRLGGLNARPLTREAAQAVRRQEEEAREEGSQTAGEPGSSEAAERKEAADWAKELANLGGLASASDEEILVQEEVIL